MTPTWAKFSRDDAQLAAETWGANCGPGAIAGILEKTLEEIRPFLGDFEQKHYTNPRLMLSILNRLDVKFIPVKLADQLSWASWPDNSLIRVQWEGPWTEEGRPMSARQRHTHWVGCKIDEGRRYIFDINCICVGGWVPMEEWKDWVVPWLLRECEPEANGKWHSTHILRIIK